MRFVPAAAALFAAVAAAVFLAPALAAPDDVIARRQAVMKRMGEQAEAGGAIVKGQAAFDAAKAAAMFQAFKDQMAGFSALFPEGSQAGDTKATAAVWSDRKGFDAAIAAFDTAVADNAAAGATPAGFKAAFTAVAGECRSCHQGFKRR